MDLSTDSKNPDQLARGRLIWILNYNALGDEVKNLGLTLNFSQNVYLVIVGGMIKRISKMFVSTFIKESGIELYDDQENGDVIND